MKYIFAIFSLIFTTGALAGGYITYDPFKILFIENPASWSSANGGASFPNDANHFHFYRSADSKVEFESDGLMQFYIESGTGKDAWYGIQDGANHRWSIGTDASDSFDLKFVGNHFGIDQANAKFVVKQNATVYPGALGTETAPSYSFNGDSNTGIYTPGFDNIAITAGGVEAVRFTSLTTQNMRLWSAGIGTSGMHVIGIPNGTAPTSSPSGGGQLYVVNGALYFRGSAGTVTMIAPQ